MAEINAYVSRKTSPPDDKNKDLCNFRICEMYFYASGLGRELAKVYAHNTVKLKDI